MKFGDWWVMWGLVIAWLLAAWGMRTNRSWGVWAFLIGGIMGAWLLESLVAAVPWVLLVAFVFYLVVPLIENIINRIRSWWEIRQMTSSLHQRRQR